MHFIIEKSEETTFSFSQNSAAIILIMETQKIVNLLNGSDNENSKLAIKNSMLLTAKHQGLIQKMIQ